MTCMNTKGIAIKQELANRDLKGNSIALSIPLWCPLLGLRGGRPPRGPVGGRTARRGAPWGEGRPPRGPVGGRPPAEGPRGGGPPGEGPRGDKIQISDRLYKAPEY